MTSTANDMRCTRCGEVSDRCPPLRVPWTKGSICANTNHSANGNLCAFVHREGLRPVSAVHPPRCGALPETRRQIHHGGLPGEHETSGPVRGLANPMHRNPPRRGDRLPLGRTAGRRNPDALDQRVATLIGAGRCIAALASTGMAPHVAMPAPTPAGAPAPAVVHPTRTITRRHTGGGPGAIRSNEEPCFAKHRIHRGRMQRIWCDPTRTTGRVDRRRLPVGLRRRSDLRSPGQPAGQVLLETLPWYADAHLRQQDEVRHLLRRTCGNALQETAVRCDREEAARGAEDHPTRTPANIPSRDTLLARRSSSPCAPSSIAETDRGDGRRQLADRGLRAFGEAQRAGREAKDEQTEAVVDCSIKLCHLEPCDRTGGIVLSPTVAATTPGRDVENRTCVTVADRCARRKPLSRHPGRGGNHGR